MKKNFRKVVIQRLEGNFYSPGAILIYASGLVISSLDNNKANRAPMSRY